AEYWQAFFLDTSSPTASLAWIGQRLLKLGNYGTTGMGGPLLLLAAVGGWRLARRSPDQLALLLGPFALMFAASALRFYPLEDRLFFFALPWLWLLAAAGIESVLTGCAAGIGPRYRFHHPSPPALRGRDPVSSCGR